VNGAQVTSESDVISINRLGADGTLKLSAGKKRHVLVRVV
jgi:hypothetical protein